MGAVGKLYELVLEYTEKLDELSKRDLGDWVVFYSALHLLQSQAQALIDLFQRACSLKGLACESYYNAGERLKELGIISEDDLRFYKKVVGFRNLVVHEYARVDQSRVREIVSRKDYRRVLELARKVLDALGDP
ncbi:MAG: DUF86 domain-containing protein [Thermoprotei archaeon]